MGVGRGHHVGPGRVDLGVDGEGGRVDRAVALHDVALVVDQDQVGHRDLAEVDGERVDPEEVRVLRVPGRDVAGHALVEAELREQPEPAASICLRCRRSASGSALTGLGCGISAMVSSSFRAVRRL